MKGTYGPKGDAGERERETEAVGGVVAGRRVVKQGKEKGREDKEKGAGGPPY